MKLFLFIFIVTTVMISDTLANLPAQAVRTIVEALPSAARVVRTELAPATRAALRAVPEVRAPVLADAGLGALRPNIFSSLRQSSPKDLAHYKIPTPEAYENMLNVLKNREGRTITEISEALEMQRMESLRFTLPKSAFENFVNSRSGSGLKSLKDIVGDATDVAAAHSGKITAAAAALAGGAYWLSGKKAEDKATVTI